MPGQNTVSITSDGGLEQRANQEQYYLLFMLPQILQKLDALKSSDPNTKTHFDDWANYFNMDVANKNGNLFLFQTFSKTANIPELNNIPPSVLSALIPQIRLYKVFYEEEFNPFLNWQIPFDDHNDPQDVTNILDNKKGGLTNVNIQSFNYSFIGTNPAEAENCLTAKLVLKFQSIDSLITDFEIQKYDSDSYKKGDIVETPRQRTINQPLQTAGNYRFRYSDLVNQEKRINANGAFNANYFRIKAAINYNITEQQIRDIYDSAYYAVDPQTSVQNLVKAINSMQHVLYLYHVGHQLSFEQDGKITLTIDYRGAIENILIDDRADIFFSTPRGRKLISDLEQEKISKQQALQQARQNAFDASKGCVNTGDQPYKDAIKAEEERTAKETKRINADRLALQSEILSTLIGFAPKAIPDSLIVTRISASRVGTIYYYADGTTTLNTAKAGSLTQGQIIQQQAQTNSSIFKISISDQALISRDPTDSDSQQINDPLYLASNRQFGGLTALGTDPKLTRLDANQLASLYSSVVDASRSGDPNDVAVNKFLTLDNKDEIKFLFLGDILRIALGSLGNIGAGARVSMPASPDVPKFIFGNIGILFPDQYGNIIVSADNSSVTLDSDTVLVGSKSTKIVYVNLAYLPVSINFFNKWYLNTVIKSKKSKYPLQVFLNDIIELIRISTLYIFPNSFASALNSRTLGLGLTVDDKLWNQLNGGEYNFENLFANDRFNGVGVRADALMDVEKSKNIYLIYVQSIPMPSVKATNVAKNQENGIFTFTIGRNVGIVKDINFQKQSIPFMQEARMTQEGELRRGVLRMKYDAMITMYGICLFRPGDVIVINPVFLTRFSDTETQTAMIDELGLGGIYVITKTETDIYSGNHTTKLNCVFMAYGDGSVPSLGAPLDYANCPASSN
jgi:hypothetical protein